MFEHRFGYIDTEGEYVGENATPRDTEVKKRGRGRIPDTVRVALWAANAGRCTMCNANVAGEEHSHYHTVLTGQMAHNVGATDGRRSPRRNPFYRGNREAPENLLLLCPGCHRLIDNPEHEALYTTENLRKIKDRHERRIALMTEEAGLTRTAVLRLGGSVNGHLAMPTRRDSGAALVSVNYLPNVETRTRGDFEYELSGVATDSSYWEHNSAQITKKVGELMQVVDDGSVKHVSVFGFAPVPLLVHLGAQVGAKVPNEVFQLHRDGEGWAWPDDEPEVGFAYSKTTGSGDDVVLVVEVTSSVNLDRLPDALRSATRLSLTLDGAAHSARLMRNRGTLTNFRKTFAEMLAAAEGFSTSGTRWHLVAATPNSVSVATGQEFMAAQPAVAVYEYDKTTDTYLHVLDVNSPKGNS